MNKIVISGGPHSGKTSLIEALQEAHPQFEYLPEPATVVVKESQTHRGVYWRDIFNSPLEFCTLCVTQSLKAEASVKPDVDYVFMDRSLVDTIAYARRDHCEELVPRVKTLATEALYKTVLFCEPVGELSNRIENTQEAAYTHSLLRAAYEEMAIPFVSIPKMPLNDRLEFIDTVLSLSK